MGCTHKPPDAMYHGNTGDYWITHADEQMARSPVENDQDAAAVWKKGDKDKDSVEDAKDATA